MHRQERAFSTHVLAPAVGFVVIVVFQTLLLYRYWPAVDLPLWDESNYMGWGAKFARGIAGLTAVSNSPAYVLVYAGLVAAFGEIAAVFLMRLTTTILLSAVVLAFLLRHLRCTALALFLVLLWASSCYNMGTNWLIYKFATLLFVLTLIHARSGQRWATCLLLALCALVRLEYLLVFAAYAAYIAVRLVRKRTWSALGHRPRGRRDYVALGVAVPIGLLIVFVAIRVDSWSMGGRRTWFAFRQHYAFRQVQAERCVLDPWLDYAVVIEKDFPLCNSLTNALRTNPRALLGHVAANVLSLPRVIFGLLLPISRKAAWPILVVFLLLCVTNARTLVSPGHWRRAVQRVKSSLSHAGDAPVLSLMGLTGLLPSLLVYAKNKYALMALPVLLLGMGYVCEALLTTGPHTKCGDPLPTPPPGAKGPRERLVRSGPVTLCAVTLAVVVLDDGLFRVARRKPVYDKVKNLRAVWPNANTKLLGVLSFSYANYLGWHRCTPIEPFGDSTGPAWTTSKVTLAELIARHKPDAVLISPRFLQSAQFDKDSISVLDSPRWDRHEIGCDETLHLRNDRLSQP